MRRRSIIADRYGVNQQTGGVVYSMNKRKRWDLSKKLKSQIEQQKEEVGRTFYIYQQFLY